jgi:hypothetical protein
MSIAITIPDIGDFAEVEVIEILVKVGDTLPKSNRSSRLNPTKPAWKFHRALRV